MLLDLPPPQPCTKVDVRQLTRGRCSCKAKITTVKRRRTCLEIYRDVLTCVFMLMGIIGLVLCCFHAKLTFDMTRRCEQEHKTINSFLYRNGKGDIYRIRVEKVVQEEALLSGEKIYDSYRFVPITTPTQTSPQEESNGRKVGDGAAESHHAPSSPLSSSSSSEEIQRDATFSSTTSPDSSFSPDDPNEKIGTSPKPTFETENAEPNEIFVDKMT